MGGGGALNAPLDERLLGFIRMRLYQNRVAQKCGQTIISKLDTVSIHFVYLFLTSVICREDLGDSLGGSQVHQLNQVSTSNFTLLEKPTKLN